MTWTNKKPTAPGWYWYAHAGYQSVVVWVVRREDKLMGLFPGDADEHPLSPDALGRWMGPLDCPTLKVSS